MNLDASADGYKAEHLVAINRVTAFGKLKVQSFQVLVDDKHVVFEVLVFRCSLHAISFRTAIEHFVVGFRFLLLHFHEALEDVVGIQLFDGNVLIEKRDGLVTHLLDEFHHDGFIVVHLMILELALKCFLGKFCLACFDFLQCLADLGACLRCGDNTQPVLLWRLRVRRHDFHLVATVQLLAELDILTIYFGANTLASQLGMDAKSKIKHSRSFRKLEQVALRCKDEDFILIEFEFELIHHFEVASGIFKRFTDGGKPFVKAAFAFHALISPVGSKSSFGNVVHTFGADLHFHPFAFRPHHRGVERFIAIALRHT